MSVNNREPRIRRARGDEAESLSALIMRSKAHWGYGADQLALWRESLIIAAETIASEPVYCAEDAGAGVVMGMSHFYAQGADEVYLDRLFIEPRYIGHGVGALLWRHMVAQAAALGARSVTLGADYHARPFYERMGAVVVEWQESAIPGRFNPVMRYDLPPR